MGPEMKLVQSQTGKATASFQQGNEAIVEGHMPMVPESPMITTPAAPEWCLFGLARLSQTGKSRRAPPHQCVFLVPCHQEIMVLNLSIAK